MADRDKLAQQIGSWLTKPSNEHQFAGQLKIALAETFPVQSVEFRTLKSEAQEPIIRSSGIDLHLIRDEMGTAVSYARSRGRDKASLLSVTNASPLPGLIDEGLDRLSDASQEGDTVSVVLNPSISYPSGGRRLASGAKERS